MAHGTPATLPSNEYRVPAICDGDGKLYIIFRNEFYRIVP